MGALEAPWLEGAEAAGVCPGVQGRGLGASGNVHLPWKGQQVTAL